MSGCKESMYGLITAKVNGRRNYESEVKSLGKKNFLRKPIAYTILLHCINIYIYIISLANCRILQILTTVIPDEKV